MKKVLLTTTALVAFAGYAAAEVTFGGEVTVGYNDVEENGIYLDGSLDITGSAEFDGGVSVSVSYGLDLYSGDFDDFPTITVTTPWATLTVGDVEYAAVDMFNQLDGMTTGNQVWREVDGEVVARVDATFGGFTVGVAVDAFGDEYNRDAMSLGAAGEFGAFRFTVGYDQAGDFNGNDVYAQFFGVSAGTTFGGFDIDVAYVSEDHWVDTNSYGVAVSTTMGGVGLSGYYAVNSHRDDAYGVAVDYTMGALTLGAYWDGDNGDEDSVDSNFGVDVEYAVNDTISAFAGWDEGDGFYVYGTMMAGAAEIGAGYAEYTEAGPAEIREGVSVWMTLPF